MVAFLCEQELYLLKGRGSNIESWKSSLPFVRFVSGKCRDIPILLGFGKLLEACILQHILAMETERFERCPLPDASSESLTPNANAAGANDRGRERDYYLNMKSQLLRTIRDTSTAWSEASQNITVDDMRLNYKTTWEKRSLRWVDPATVKPRVGSYKCDYFLPLHPNSTLLEAVNFGYWFLTEWSQIHGLKFKSEIRL